MTILIPAELGEKCSFQPKLQNTYNVVIMYAFGCAHELKRCSIVTPKLNYTVAEKKLILVKMLAKYVIIIYALSYAHTPAIL